MASMRRDPLEVATHKPDSDVVGSDSGVVLAAEEWVENIHDYPSIWMGAEEDALIRAVMTRNSTVRMRGEFCKCGSGACGPTWDWNRWRV